MRTITILLFLSILTNHSMAQFVVKGTLLDEKKNAIPNVELVAYHKDSVKSVSITDELGKFTLKLNKGQYILKAKIFNQQALEQSINVERDTNINDITAHIAITLNEISIIRKKPVIEREIDRLIFNVKNSIVGASGNAIDALRAAPLINVNSNGIEIVGKSKLGLLVNGRKVALNDGEVSNYLQNIRAENIDRIEIITTPPSNYDSEGNSGLINVVLKKNENQGISGGIGLNYRRRTYSGISPSLNINYQKNKLNISSSFSYDGEGKRPLSEVNITSAQKEWYIDAVRKDFSHIASSNINLNYKISKRSVIGFTANGFALGGKSDAMNNNLIYTNQRLEEDSLIKANNMTKNINNFVSILGYYEKNLDSTGKKIVFNLNYTSKYNLDNIDLSTQTFIKSRPIYSYDALNNIEGNYNVISSNIDFILPIELAKIEFGSKITLVNNNSKTNYFDLVDSKYIKNDNQSNDYNYKENIIAAYISFDKSFSKKLIMKGGMRYERSIMNGFSPTLNIRNIRIFNNFFPSIFITHKIDENSSIGLNYSRRVGRPSFTSLNPFRFYQNQYVYSTGNPFIQPSFTNNLELSYLHNSFSLTLYASKQVNAVGQVTQINNDTLITSPLNIYNESTLGISLSYNFNKIKFWESFTSIRSAYNYSRPFNNFYEIPINAGFFTFITSTNNIYLDEKKRKTIFFNVFHSFPGKTGLYEIYARTSLDLGFRTSFISNNLQLNIAIFDVLKTNRNQAVRLFQGTQQYTSIYNDMRYLSVGVNYNFGSKKVKSFNKVINSEERNRL